MFNCFLCDYQFELTCHLLIHLNIFHDPQSIKEFVCKQPYCFRVFGSLDSFKKHINSYQFIPVLNNIIHKPEIVLIIHLY